MHRQGDLWWGTGGEGRGETAAWRHAGCEAGGSIPTGKSASRSPRFEQCDEDFQVGVLVPEPDLFL